MGPSQLKTGENFTELTREYSVKTNGICSDGNGIFSDGNGIFPGLRRGADEAYC